MIIDHTSIPKYVLEIARSNAALDPDGQVFPWAGESARGGGCDRANLVRIAIPIGGRARA